MTVTQKVIVGQSVYRSFGQSVFVKQSVNLQVSLTIYQSITISHCNLAINSSVVCQAANQSVSQSINPRRMKHATLVKAFGLVQESAESCALSIFFRQFRFIMKNLLALSFVLVVGRLSHGKTQILHHSYLLFIHNFPFPKQAKEILKKNKRLVSFHRRCISSTLYNPGK